MTFLGIILAIALIFIFEEVGIYVIAAIVFGFVFSSHMKNKQILKDLKKIKEKLGIEEEGSLDHFSMNNEDIE